MQAFYSSTSIVCNYLCEFGVSAARNLSVPFLDLYFPSSNCRALLEALSPGKMIVDWLELHFSTSFRLDQTIHWPSRLSQQWLNDDFVSPSPRQAKNFTGNALPLFALHDTLTKLQHEQISDMIYAISFGQLIARETVTPIPIVPKQYSRWYAAWYWGCEDLE